ncbi:MAG: PSD1 and planctomycete cytochrome C domain-containing protein, partial [Pirellulaceae bacterium]
MFYYGLRFVAAICLAFPVAIGEASDKIDFRRAIRPILVTHCGECHSGDEKNGGLSLDDPSSIFAQADSGQVAVVAGDVDASEILNRLTSKDDDLRMPPEGAGLSPDQVEMIRQWINEGAAWPTELGSTAKNKVETTHWAFQPLASVAPPKVDNSWARNPLDRFIAAKRDMAGLVATSDADPVTLIRRANYVLTGLPPTPEQVAAFVADFESPNGPELAFVTLVNRLLQHPTYGERWGRHWMDWVRYADTAGDNSDFPIPQAYLYRNYIIDSFNNDVPYDRFLTEQLAGDLLSAETQAERNRLTIATGYLAMARRFGSLIERYPWHLTIEDTIDNVGRTMMGLTIACARCHDHKFDPVSTRDYYGLYGIFASTRYPQPGLELFQAQQHLVPLIPTAEAAEVFAESQAKTDQLSAELEKLLAVCEERKVQNAAKESDASIAEQRKMNDDLDDLLIKARRAGEALAEHLKNRPAIPVAYAVQEGLPQNAPIQIRGEPNRPGATVARKFPEVLGGHDVPDEVAGSSSGRLELAQWIASPNNPLTARVIVNRVWQRHFGQGIVPSTSDFGLRGQSPTHPELLDWLTADFIDNGWSLKHLHRTMMLSRTWQLSSQDINENLAIDPTNQLYWKTNRRRLDAESIRDTMMSIAGTLDPNPQNEPYPIPPQSTWKYTQHHPFKDEYSSNKRSVYLMTKRLTAESYFQTFDGADPNVCTSNRDESVTPLQALYFVNNDFFHEQSEQFAKRLLAKSVNDEERLTFAFTSIVARPPSDSETKHMQAHLAAVKNIRIKDADASQFAWASLVRSLLRLN